jgi:hypothetical protein
MAWHLFWYAKNEKQECVLTHSGLQLEGMSHGVSCRFDLALSLHPSVTLLASNRNL